METGAPGDTAARLLAHMESLAGNPETARKALEQLLRYRELAMEWNKKVNLTAIDNEDEFLAKHYADSFTCAGSPEFADARRIVDVGTGGGFPGIPLAVLWPEKEFVLIDSLNKRVRIVGEMAETIGLSNVRTVHGRAEDLARVPAYRDRFDLCVSRAVASLPVLLELCLPFVKPGGSFIAYKGPEIDKEATEGLRAANLLGGALNRIEHPAVPGFESGHTLVYYQKTGFTPKAYPRKAGTPAKEPLR